MVKLVVRKTAQSFIEDLCIRGHFSKVAGSKYTKN